MRSLHGWGLVFHHHHRGRPGPAAGYPRGQLCHRAVAWRDEVAECRRREKPAVEELEIVPGRVRTRPFSKSLVLLIASSAIHGGPVDGSETNSLWTLGFR